MKCLEQQARPMQMNQGSNLRTSFYFNFTKSEHAHSIFMELQGFILAFSIFKFIFYLYIFFLFFPSSLLSFSSYRRFLSLSLLLSSSHSPLFSVPFPSFLLSHFYPISNYHFPLMKLDEDYDYV